MCSCTLSLTSALGGGGWAPGPVWTNSENLAPTGIRSTDRPARSESLYRLSYPGLTVLSIVLCFGIEFSCRTLIFTSRNTILDKPAKFCNDI